MKGDYTVEASNCAPRSGGDHPQMKGDYTHLPWYNPVVREEITPK